MMLLLILAALLIAFAGFCAFGLPYMLCGPRMLDELQDNREQQIMGSVIVGVIIMLVLSPFASSALISATAQVQVMADTFVGQGWS
ncbi:hypothetical protein [Hyphomonas pacifica]|uniref:Uncharacterized protein n=1 Tax=Hyphomonas pacifica TaxID=1280941 RepID=A0A062TZA7_9PROT|nr:hypothetical protein [Hyphomonas pacifica]KCZ46208.1 hypothetical protein HY2_05875 [Hyphomonas pacifica]RAN31515.1 hypothetical protein HY11_07045 [Hyphomonas pacifica]RAN35810.1 hypothetical protein HY3_06850 [Hyphomonas pacifica]